MVAREQRRRKIWSLESSDGEHLKKRGVEGTGVHAVCVLFQTNRGYSVFDGSITEVGRRDPLIDG